MQMKLFVLLEVLMMVFASDKNDFVENDPKSTGDCKHIGVIYKESSSKWEAHRWSTTEKKLIYNGPYKDEETAAHASDTLARKLMRMGEKGHKLNFPDDDTEMDTDEKIAPSVYIGVSYHKRDKMWGVHRWSKKEKKQVCNGAYNAEETAAHASDTLARVLMANGEKNHKLNFPCDNTEVYPDKAITTSKYHGVSYNGSKWAAMRRNKTERKMVYNGTYKDEETAAHASDTLARTLMRNGEKGHKLNFPHDDTEVYTKKINYIGVNYIKIRSTWGASRYSRSEKKMVYNGATYNDEKTAAHASDTLARTLIANGEKDHKLNFPDDHTEMNSKEAKYQKKRKRQKNLENSDDEILSD